MWCYYFLYLKIFFKFSLWSGLWLMGYLQLCTHLPTIWVFYCYLISHLTVMSLLCFGIMVMRASQNNLNDSLLLYLMALWPESMVVISILQNLLRLILHHSIWPFHPGELPIYRGKECVPCNCQTECSQMSIRSGLLIVFFF